MGLDGPAREIRVEPVKAPREAPREAPAQPQRETVPAQPERVPEKV